jgi:hypothetical protein
MNELTPEFHKAADIEANTSITSPEIRHFLNPTPDQLMYAAVDITAPRNVEIKVREDGSVIWVNVDGVCVLRVCQIPHLQVDVPPYS